MTEKELKHLRRADLLELLLEQSRENERLRRELAQAQAKLEDRTILVESTGSLAEAALALSGVFEAAQDACDLYLENVRLRNPMPESPGEEILAQRKRTLACPVRKVLQAIAALTGKLAAAVSRYKKTPQEPLGLSDGE